MNDPLSRPRGELSRLRSVPVRALVVLGLLALVVTSGVLGVIVAQRAAGATVRHFALGTIETHVRPALPGAIDIYIPIVDWGVRARPHRMPLLVSIRFRSLDRTAALRALRSGDAAARELASVQRGLESSVRAEMRRASLMAVVGGLVGGVLVGVVLATRRGPRWLLLGPLGGVGTALVVVGLFAIDLAHADYGEVIRSPSFYARGDELPELLAFSSQLFTVSAQYTEDFDRAVAGLSNLVAAASGGTGIPEAAETLVLGSDIHSNMFVFPTLQRYARGRPVFLAGDFALLGTPLEEGIVPQVAALSDTVVAVSGNHDSQSLMRALARAGVIVLTRHGRLQPDGRVTGSPVVEVARLRVAGFDDPLERRDNGLAGHRLEGADEFLTEVGGQVVDWFHALPERPDIVMIHQHRLAHVLLDALEAAGGPRVIILTGHDHWVHHHEAGGHLLVDGGTLGAGGPFAIGETPAGFALIHLDHDRRPLAIDLIEVEPISGQGRVRRVVPTREPDDEPEETEAGSPEPEDATAPLY